MDCGVKELDFPSHSKFEQAGIFNELHKLFVLVWNELFHEQSLDSWQVRSANIRTILSEIVDTVEIAQSYPPFRHNLKALLSEAIGLTAIDPVVGKHYPFVRSYLESAAKTLKNGETAN